jgi:hypothetical protein
MGGGVVVGTGVSVGGGVVGTGVSVGGGPESPEITSGMKLKKSVRRD